MDDAPTAVQTNWATAKDWKISTPADANAGINFRGNMVMGTAVPDMYIFRMYRPPILAGAA
jgi:hypothetical protein